MNKRCSVFFCSPNTTIWKIEIELMSNIFSHIRWLVGRLIAYFGNILLCQKLCWCLWILSFQYSTAGMRFFLVHAGDNVGGQLCGYVCIEVPGAWTIVFGRCALAGDGITMCITVFGVKIEKCLMSV